MKKKYINEQTNLDGFLQKAVKFGCFNPDKYSWFTIDTKNPIQTIDGKTAVVGTMDEGKDTVYFFGPDAGQKLGYYQVKGLDKKYYWDCDMNQSRKEKFITDFIEKNGDYVKEEPSDFKIGREYAKIDLSTLSDIFKPGERFIYKRINTVGTKILQQDNIERALNLAGFTLDEPDITQPEHDTIQDIRYIMGGKYKKYYQPLIDLGKTGDVYQMTKKQKEDFNAKSSGETENNSSEIITDPKELLRLSKTKEFTKRDCRLAIKALYNMSKSKLKIDDATLLGLKKTVFGCYNQNTKFNTGTFGVGDELNYLTGNFSKYGIADLLSGSVKESLNINMKNLIKENLIKTSVKKQQRLLSENTIIVNRYKLLTENINPKSKKDVKKFFDLVITETAYLHSQEYNKDLIKESFFDLMSGLFGNASSGIFQYFKEHIATWLMRKFGFDPNSWLGNIIVVSVGNLPLTELHNLTNCSFVSKLLSKNIAEGAINKIKNEQGLTGPGYDILRNAMVEMAEDSSFGQKIEHKISDYICPKLQGLSGKIENVTKNIKSNALKTDQSSVGGKVKNLATKGVDKLKSLVS